MKIKSYLFALIVGLILAYLFVNAKTSVDKIGFAILGLFFFGIFAGFKMSQFSGGFMGRRISEWFIAPKVYLREKPEMLSPIEGLILQRQYAEAEQQLLEILGRKPHLRDAVVMLGQLYLDNLRNNEAAETVTGNYMLRRKKVVPGDIQVVNLHIDACLGLNKKSQAMTCIENEMKRPGYLPGEVSTLRSRLEALTK